MNRSALLWTFVGGLIAGTVISIVVYRHAMLAGPREAADGRVPASPRPSASLVPGEVRIDPAMIQNLGVRSVQVEPRAIKEAIQTTGYVDYDQRRVTQVNARISGWVQKLYVAYVGQEVRRGQPLLEVYSPELMLTEEDYLRSRRLAEEKDSSGAAQIDANNLMSAAEARLRLFGIAPSEVRKLEQRGWASQAVPLEAPSSGVITDIKVVEGSYVKAGADLYTIADLSPIWVYADIYERELPMAKVGQQAVVVSDALPGESFRGNVDYIYPVVNEQTRTVKVRLEFANPRRQLRPGMYVKATLLAEAPRKMLAIPAEAVLNSGLRRIVIVDLKDHFMPREIKVGSESGGYVQVLQGLKAGERVVTSGQFLIDSESNLSEALKAMALDSGGGGSAARTPVATLTPASGR